LKRSRSSSLDVGKPVADCPKRVLSLFVSLVFDVSMNENFIEREVSSAVSELFFDKPFEGS
jgi:hypothetical protein